jgi:hypothetical protein
MRFHCYSWTWAHLGNDLEDRHAEELVAVPAEELARGTVDISQTGVEVRPKERVWRQLDELVGVCRGLLGLGRQSLQLGIGLVERATPLRRQVRDVHDDQPVDRVQERLKHRLFERVSGANDDEHAGGNRQTGYEGGQARTGADVKTRYQYCREEQDERGACPRQRREKNTHRERGHDRAEGDEITRSGLLRRLRSAWMAALTDAARDVGTSDVGNGRQIAKVRFSDWQPAWAVMARDVPPSSRPARDRSRLLPIWNRRGCK